MDFIVNESDTLCDAFFMEFDPLWSRPNQRQGFRAYARGLLSKTHRKNIEAMNAKMVAPDYQSLILAPASINFSKSTCYAKVTPSTLS